MRYSCASVRGMSKDQLEEIVKEADASLELKLLQELRRVAMDWERCRPGYDADEADSEVRRVLAALDEAGFISETFGVTEAEAAAAESVAPTLLDMVDAIDDLAVEGLTPALHRMAETLSHMHERMVAVEEERSARLNSTVERAVRPEVTIKDAVEYRPEHRYAEKHTIRTNEQSGRPATRWSTVCPEVWGMWVSYKRAANLGPASPGDAGWIAACKELDALARPDDDDAPDSKSGRPTPAAEEIARLTEECKRGRELVKQMQPLVAAGLRDKGWCRQGQEWAHANHGSRLYGERAAIRLQAEWDQA